ncbi:hypothetical protein GIB67_020035 [Kingdonia uniflora]|uniref:Disease resistance R13L4/SHOC-2-like LRR domain-containing protein n=1 Tax=Kingdonia uniflora TaxID=39325 RepID=A0A7J7N455_9MAGN|nr:hypothetical protein GIB67_020035 [Kingdonia uniflora]
MEDIGEKFLVELIDRCMVVVEKTDLMRRIRRCRILNLMRDLCTEKANTENFLQKLGGNQWSGSESSSAIPDYKCRRHAFHFNGERYANFTLSSTPHLRTLLYFCPNSMVHNLLRVLNFEGVGRLEMKMLLEVGKLMCLRFLGLMNSEIEVLPPSIGNLGRLQTLDLRVSTNMYVRDVIWKMKQLRHLYISEWCNSKDLRVGTLRNLQTLDGIEAGPWITKDLGNLSKLRKLGICMLYLDPIS